MSLERFGYCCRCGLCCGTCEHLDIVGKVGTPESSFCKVYDRREEFNCVSGAGYPYNSLDVEERKDICTYFFK